MTKHHNIPVIFLAFSNALDSDYLELLKQESTLLRDLLLPLDDLGRLKLLREESTNNGDIPKLLTQYKGQMAVFHYGGHADGQHLDFEDQKGHISGLAELLGLQENLKLVFLNGCETQKQAEPYLEAGIPIVIATTRAIADREAVYFTQCFYQALASEHSIEESFRLASGAMKSRLVGRAVTQNEWIKYRSIGRKNAEWSPSAWRLYFKEGEEGALSWRIPKARKSMLRFVLWFLGMLLIVLSIIGFSEKSLGEMLNLNPPDQQTLDLTVFVKSDEEQQTVALGKEATLILDLGTDRRTAEIGTNGKAHFSEIPLKFKDTKVRLELQALAHVAIVPDTLYVLNDEPIYLAVTDDLDLGMISGLVKNEAGTAFLQGVAIMVDHETTTTDEFGSFELLMPKGKRKQRYELHLNKPGYQSKSERYYPRTGPIEIRLEKSNP